MTPDRFLMPDAAAHRDDASGEEQGPATPAASESSRPKGLRPGRHDVIAATLLCLVTFALWLPRLGGPIDLRTDAAVYYITGVALAEGKGYSLLNEPGEVAAVQYPPGLPAFVALHRWLVGSADPQVLGAALRKSYLLISLAYAVAVYAVARRLLAPISALAAGLITSLFLQTYFLSNSLFSEIPFALVAMLFLLAAPRSDRPGWFALCSVLAATAFLIRSAGVALLAAWVGEALLRRQWKQLLARAVVAAIPFLGWQYYVSSVTGSAQYQQPVYEYQRAAYLYYNVPYAQNVSLLDPFQPELGPITRGAVARRYIENLKEMPLTMGHCVSTVPGYFEWTLRDAHNWLGVPRVPVRVARIPPTFLGVLVIGGLVLLAFRRQWLLVLYAMATVGLVCLTPWPVQFTRYLTPLTPILTLAMLLFLEQLRHWPAAERRLVAAERCSDAKTADGSSASVVTMSGAQGRLAWAGRALMALVLAGILLMQLYSLTRAYRSGWTHVSADLTRVGGGKLFFFDEKWQAYAQAVDWLRGRVEEGEVVAAATPQWAHVAGGYKSVMPPMEIDRQKAQTLLDSVPVRWAIVDDQDVGGIVSRYLAPAIQAHPEEWRLIHEVAVHRKDDETQPPAIARIYERVQ